MLSTGEGIPGWRGWGELSPQTEREALPPEAKRQEQGENADHQPESQEPLFPSDYISLGVGWARSFLKMTNQLPNLSHSLGGFSDPASPPVPF